MKYLLITVFVIKVIHEAACIDYDGWLQINMRHNVGCGTEKFCTRGKISLKSIRAGTPIIEQVLLGKDHLKELKELAEVDGFYSIHTTVTTADNKDTGYLSSMKARTFLESGLSDLINVWVLPNGEVMAVNFQATNSSQSLATSGTGYKINSKFYLHFVDQAPVPDTASFIQKLEREREAREKGELTDNRSFLAKYWMYIVPIAIFVMISGAANPEAQQPSR